MYKGELRGEVKHGKGTYKWTDGTVFEGEYCMNLKHGWGKLLTPELIGSEEQMMAKEVKFEYGVE